MKLLRRVWEWFRPGVLWKQLLVVLAGLAVLALLIAASGVVRMRASSGHWKITEMVLQFGKRRSVQTNAAGIEVPPLDRAGLVMQGAGHFDIGCSPCHGSPGLWAPRIALAMTPYPPGLAWTTEKWAPAELFYIVKHGLKFTGMPAWPAQQRDDEVWAIVAFMRKLSELDATAYARLVGEEEDELPGIAMLDLDAEGVPKALASHCARCHGADGRGRLPGAFPKLAGQRAQYMEQALRAYAMGNRYSGIMGPVAAGLTESEARGIANYYERLNSGSPQGVLPAGDERLTRGAAIAARGIPAQGVPPCMQCHGPGAPSTNPAYPVLSGQDVEYLVGQLELFKRGQRGGADFAGLMEPVVRRMTMQQMVDVASFYASLSGGSLVQR